MRLGVGPRAICTMWVWGWQGQWQQLQEGRRMGKQNKNYHVVPDASGWAVRRENSERASSRHRTQSDAIDAGRNFAQRAHGELRIHRRDGSIRDSDSYGNDPNPPRDRKH